MYDYSILEFPRELKAILNEVGIVNDSDLLIFLEQYKFYDRGKLLSFLKKITGKKGIFADVKTVQRDYRYAPLEERLNVLISVIDSGTIEVITSATNEINMAVLDLEFGLSVISLVYVTPVNYEELQGKERCVYDPTVLFKRILLEAIRMKATDIHFDVKHIDIQPSYTVSVRVNGELLPLDLFLLDSELNRKVIGSLVERRTTASSMDLFTPAGVVASSSNIFGDDNVELRISANKVKEGYHYVIRIQQKNTFGFTIDKLGFHPNVLSSLHRIAKKRSGITFITGAIRTGKNTTAFAMANEMVNDTIKIISYESPIEVLMPFTQVDYQEDTNILADAVRLAKKQDVNVAFINEIPNKEVAFVVRDLVNSSIHVITTIHMNRIWHLPYKLKEYYGEDYKDVISQINAVYNQKMFGIPCSNCKDRVLVETIENKKHYKFLKESGVNAVWKNHGCEHCNGNGNRPGANQPYVEFLEFDDKLIRMLLECESPYLMEGVIRNRVKEQSLERFMLDGLKEGELSYETLDYLF